MSSFLTQFLFANGGAYTLFGEKPMSEMLIFIGSETDLIELTEEEMKTAIPLDRSLVENWKAWKRYAEEIDSNHFIFAERPCLLDPSHTIYSLLNVDLAKDLLSKYRTKFEEQVGFPFDINQVIHEFKDPASSFWGRVLSDHVLSGLLLGYGEENIDYFLDRLKTDNGTIRFSDDYDPTASSDHFPLPIFALSPEDKTTDRYREQRTKIRHIYQDRDIIDVTFQRLIGKSAND